MLFLDLRGQYARIKDEVDSGIQRVIESAAFINGAEVSAFCSDFASYLGCKHVVPVGNGTDAIRLAMLAMGLGPGDEVITPSFTFVATAEAAVSIGCRVRFVDVDWDTFCLDSRSLLNVLDEKVKAIVPVNLFGQNCNIEALKNVARQCGEIKFIEDSCQSIGACHLLGNGIVRQSGVCGDIGCTSFFPSKNLACFGDGGALFTNSDELAQKAKSLANHGMKKKYEYEAIGYNSRLDTIQAAVLRVKLRHIEEFAEKKRHIANIYSSRLKDVSGVEVPRQGSWSTHTYHQYTLKIDPAYRDKLAAYLKSENIPTMVYYPTPLHLQKPYLQYSKGMPPLPVTERLCKSVLSLPIHTEMTDEEVSMVCDAILKFFSQH